MTKNGVRTGNGSLRGGVWKSAAPCLTSSRLRTWSGRTMGAPATGLPVLSVSTNVASYADEYFASNASSCP